MMTSYISHHTSDILLLTSEQSSSLPFFPRVWSLDDFAGKAVAAVQRLICVLFVRLRFGAVAAHAHDILCVQCHYDAGGSYICLFHGFCYFKICPLMPYFMPPFTISILPLTKYMPSFGLSCSVCSSVVTPVKSSSSKKNEGRALLELEGMLR